MTAKRSPLRAALAKRRVRTATFQIAVADDAEPRRKLAEAKQNVLLAGIGKDRAEDAGVAKARADVDAAQAEVDACYHQLQMRAIPRADFEALLAAHPAAEGAPADAQWDEKTLAPALLAPCAVDSDLTEQDWAEELAAWSYGDSRAVFVTVMNVNRLAVNEGLGKG